MTLFDELQPRAKDLSTRLLNIYRKEQVGCLTFFSVFMSKADSTINDAYAISLLASNLDEQYDQHLNKYLDAHFGDLISDLKLFKNQVLT